MSKEEMVRSQFEKVQENLKDLYFTRNHFYIAHELMSLFEQCATDSHSTNSSNPLPSYTMNPETRASYLTPLISALYYFILQHRLEEAEKIVKSYFRDTPILELLKLLLLEPTNLNTLDNENAGSMVFLDKVLCFLAQIGYEGDIVELFKLLPEKHWLKKMMSLSWPILLGWFINENMAQLPNMQNSDPIEMLSGYSKTSITNIKDNTIMVDYRRWLLKRQMLAMYTIIMQLLKNDEKSLYSKHAPLLKDIGERVAETFENYASLICYTTKEYMMAALYMLEEASNPKNQPLWTDEIITNLIHQINHVKNLYADVRAFFKLTMQLDIFPHYPMQLQNEFTEKENQLLDPNLNNSISQLKMIINKSVGLDEPIIWMKDKAVLLAEIQGIIKHIITDSSHKFWSFCRDRFSPQRLKLLAASLDNQYSTAASYFFETPALKLDKNCRIDTELCSIKKWGSSGGLFERDKYLNASYGGGYLIHHHGFGLLIDPGPDTLMLLTKYTDFDVMDINGVVCTHPHHDHMAEFKRVLLGIREYNRTAGFKHLYYLFPDADDQELIHPGKTREDFCVNLFDSHVRDTTRNKEPVYYFPNTIWGEQNGIRVQPLPVKHNMYVDNHYHTKIQEQKRLEKRIKDLEASRVTPEEIKENQGKLEKIKEELEQIRVHYKTCCGKDLGEKGERWWSYGMLVSPLRNGKPLTNILFSGDAEYPPLENLFENIPAPYKPEVLILNITSARMQDVLATETGAQFAFPAQSPKADHLGYSGVLALLSKLSQHYKVAIISDYFEGQSIQDIRLLINRSLENDLLESHRKQVRILAAEPGMRFRWKNKNQMESFCSHLCNVKNKGFVKPIKANVRQAKRSPHARNESCQMICHHCEKLKKEVLEVDKIWKIL